MDRSLAFTLLDGVPREDRSRLLGIAGRREFAKGTVVFHAGDRADSLHLVVAGRFAVRAGTPLGEVATLSLVATGGYFGELALVGTETRRSATVTAVEPAATLVVDREEFGRLRREHPSVDRVLVEALARRVRELSDLLVDGYYTPVETRILRRLLEAAEVWGGARPGVTVPLTQQDVADLAGTTRPTTNRILREAEEEGLIERTRGRVTLLDPDGMARRAGC